MAERYPLSAWNTPDKKVPLEELLKEDTSEECSLVSDTSVQEGQDVINYALEEPFLLKTEVEKCEKFPHLKKEADKQHRDDFFNLQAKIEERQLEELKRESFRRYVGVSTWRGLCSCQVCMCYLMGFLMLTLMSGCGVGMIFNIIMGNNIFMPLVKPPSQPKVAASTLAQGPTAPAVQCPDEDNAHRFDCFPEAIATQAKCEARGCCWRKPDANGVPFCYFPPTFPSYMLGEVQPTPLGASAVLRRNGSSPYPRDANQLSMVLRMETDGRLHLVLNDTASRRYEVPIATPAATTKAAAPLYDVEYSHNPFGIVVKRRSNGRVLLNTTVAPLIYADQFLEMSTSLPSGNVYGLGEHRGPLRHKTGWIRIPFWARDKQAAEAKEDVTNLYGSHPFYLCVEDDGQAHGVFLLNSNAMEVILQPAPALTWRTIGGILDFYILLGPDPNSVIQQYWDVIGYPMMPPYWALGFHLCRWGYGSANRTLDIAQKMRNAGIPQDTQWNDIDYMQSHLDWTRDEAKFSELPAVVKNLHEHGQHYIMIVDPGISNVQKAGTYPPYDVGLKRGVFINDTNGNPIVGRVWPGDTTFPDFTNPITQQWWLEMAADFHKEVPFDGMWIDMNEPSNFVDGSTHGCPDNELEKPPYTPAVNLFRRLSWRSLCASSVQHLGTHYNLHSLFGLFHASSSRNALVSIRGKRPVVISRSTFPSSGRHGGHWLGDNKSTWRDMYYSIPGLLNMNMFGIPLVGADICGFGGDTNEELCLRWQQLGAFYPFSRNHNTLGAKVQLSSPFSHNHNTLGAKVQLSSLTTTTHWEQRYSFPLPSLTTTTHWEQRYSSPLSQPQHTGSKGTAFLSLLSQPQHTGSKGTAFLSLLSQPQHTGSKGTAFLSHNHNTLGAKVQLSSLTTTTHWEQRYSFLLPSHNHSTLGAKVQLSSPFSHNHNTLGAKVQLSSPFSHNHNTLGAKPQEPIVWSAATQQAIRSVLLTRYSLLPHLYFLFHRANKMGEAVARPLFFEYPTDSHTWGVDTQFLWGDSLMVTPVLEQGATKVTAYFPNDTWYDFYSGRPVVPVGQNVTLDAPRDTINLHLRGGAILVTQQPAMTTTASRQNQFGLVVALNRTLEAWGGLFWDDGDTLDTEGKKEFTMIKFFSSRNTISSQVMMSGFPGTKDMTLGSIRVYGVSQEPHTVMANKQAVDFSYVQDAQMLSLNNLTLPLSQPIQAFWA
ncbi:PREDICTED: lysosomal alpha-glucosidase-like isoform X1 [Branchiostoma belcheri]|uniref:Lysosomal alpha-glucosidase-like isoform X1 n=1 Tax=Branchiostoma belcheri TaxID=7741 RepID=A0A6P4ZUA1_BRABE|nr:PREDICTED: lysosomal alpha-glucosidase-like isoform X1 [Branchiostoma belcheri]XP_019633177.1 PREDICTED: lysosomal alpha-glucosidase-like isoform X2 [Branchiostoma belcheri]XP_019633178.1 PREDICTED: lysosomal alpha-glucosidase-like isoform X1 [Branchiostoma belcheri]